MDAQPPLKLQAKSLESVETQLPKLTPFRIMFRKFIRIIFKILISIFLDFDKSGIENFPGEGASLVVSNHLGDLDAVLGMALTPRIDSEILIKSELNDFFLLGWLLNSYGVIWIHRGQPDRTALRAVFKGIKEGRIIGIAPEGRESLTGSLEEGTRGAAYIALKADLMIIPITFIGTENKIIYNNLKRLRKSKVSITVGKPFQLEKGENLRLDLESGTKVIMNRLARQLPPVYQGVYHVKNDQENDSEYNK